MKTVDAFRIYQINFDEMNKRIYQVYQSTYENHFIEEDV